MRLEGKTALITGAGSGIGRALAIEAAARGLNLYLVGRRLSKLEETRRQLALGSKVCCIKADVTCPDGRLDILNSAAAGAYALDILINNAGFMSNHSLLESVDADVTRMIDTNLIAPILLTRDLLPVLKSSNKPWIVNVGSIFGDIAVPGFSVYAATKFGLRGLSDALRRELAVEGVSVTYVAPRATQTEGIERISALLRRQGMVLDDPATVAQWIWTAVEKERRNAYPPTAERLFIAIQRVFPSLIDRGLQKSQKSYASSRTETGGSGEWAENSAPDCSARIE